eukprot:5630725-Prymnesium_polylepis.3
MISDPTRPDDSNLPGLPHVLPPPGSECAPPALRFLPPDGQATLADCAAASAAPLLMSTH